MFTRVVSVHTNPFTCGVARFNRSLADELGVAMIPLSEYLAESCIDGALLSLKMEEVPESQSFDLISAVVVNATSFTYFVHDFTNCELQRVLSSRASRVFANSAELAHKLSELRQDTVAVYSPGARVRPQLGVPEIRLLTAGMAHKIRSDGYSALERVLKGDSRHIRLEITSAIHEGQRFDEAFFSVSQEIRRVFQHEIHFCGFLSDDELSQRLHEVDAYVAFFPGGVRENNTTVLSAMTHGCPVITNLDADSPPWMRHGDTLFDINSLETFPSGEELERVGIAGMHVASQFDFRRLAEILLQS